MYKGEYTFKLSIDTSDMERDSDGLFIDYISLLPSQYSEPNLLKKKVTQPCGYSTTSGGKCMMYDHVDLDQFHQIEDFSPNRLPVIGSFPMEPAEVRNVKPDPNEQQPLVVTICLNVAKSDWIDLELSRK